MPNEILEIRKDEPRTIVCGLVDSIDKEKQKITFCVSDETLDRHRERVSAEAMKNAIPLFASNPIACPCHLRVLANAKPPTVGRWDIPSFKQKSKASYIDMYFSKGQLGQEYWIEYRDGNMKACSISFMPIKWHEEQHKKYGSVVVFDEIELTEISLVAIGSNRNALAKELGLEPDAELKKTIDTLKDKVDAMLTLLEELNDKISDRSDFGAALLDYGNKQQQPNKQIAEDNDVATAKQIADAIRNVKI